MWEFEFRLGNPISAGFHGKCTRPNTSGRLFGFDDFGRPCAIDQTHIIRSSRVGPGNALRSIERPWLGEPVSISESYRFLTSAFEKSTLLGA